MPVYVSASGAPRKRNVEEENGKKMPRLPWLAGYVHVIGMVVHLQHAKATSDKWFSILSGDSTNKMRLVIRIAIVINLVWVHQHAHWDGTQKFRSPHFASYKTMIGLSFGTPQHTPSRCQPRICPNFGDMAAYEWYFSTFITKYAKNHNFEMP